MTIRMVLGRDLEIPLYLSSDITLWKMSDSKKHPTSEANAFTKKANHLTSETNSLTKKVNRFGKKAN